MTVFAPPNLSRDLRSNFPRSLEGVPFLMPLSGTSVRRGLDAWLERQGIQVHEVGEFADSALIKVFGQNGMGRFWRRPRLAMKW